MQVGSVAVVVGVDCPQAGVDFPQVLDYLGRVPVDYLDLPNLVDWADWAGRGWLGWLPSGGAGPGL